MHTKTPVESGAESTLRPPRGGQVEELEAQIEHALSMRAACHEVIATCTQPPDKLLALFEQEEAWLAKAKRLELRHRSLAERSVTAA
jgi:hypothetical protein